MRELAILLNFLLFTVNMQGQNDPKAISILDKFSSTVLSSPSISMNFLIITADQVANTKDTVDGSVIISKNNYRLELPDNIIWFNGEICWSYLPDEKEVTITRPDKKDDSFQSRPSSIFTMYKKGYKCRLIEDRRDSYLIDLYPEEIESELIRVRLTIEKPSLNLTSFEYKRRDGITMTLVIKDYDLRKSAGPDIFRFSPEKFKGVEVIDMR
jgi:outer membrane lipoprotein-sorting protein